MNYPTTKFESPLLRESYEKIDHPSGLPIYVFPKKMTTAYAILSVKFGSVDTKYRHEPNGPVTTLPDGTAHFLEHKLFDNPDGTDSLAIFSSLGADSNAYTDNTRTAYLFSCTEHFSEALEELLRFVTTPYFTPKSVKKERGIIAEEIRMYADNPWDRCAEQLTNGLYRRHPVRKKVCGTEKSIARITPRLLYDCYNVFYQLSNMALVVCGDVTAGEVLAVADRVLPKTAPAVRPILRVPVIEPRRIASPLMREEMPVSIPILCFGFKDVNIPSDPRERSRRDAALSLVGDALFSRSNDFFGTLFETGLITASFSYSYSICSSFADFAISCESEDPEEVRHCLIDYLDDMRFHGLDPDELERSRRVLIADRIRAFDSTEEIANDLLAFVFEEADLFGYSDLLASVTLEEANTLLRELFRKENLCLSVVAPPAKPADKT